MQNPSNPKEEVLDALELLRTMGIPFKACQALANKMGEKMKTKSYTQGYPGKAEIGASLTV